MSDLFISEWRCTSVECRYHPIIERDDEGKPVCEKNCPFFNNPEFVLQQGMLDAVIEKKLKDFDDFKEWEESI